MLNTGTKLGQYEVLSHIGSGGMGEVYRALDTRLKREVALKVLPDQFSRDPERVARFKREAQLLAQLNHHNIAAIYGVEQSDGKNFLVLELVLGETLRERIRKGPVPLEETLAICKQIAEALEHAHEKTIIHRDLKPANVKVTPEGQVKVLDFGLAKAFAGDEQGVAPLDTPTLSGSPSVPGIIIGTAAYMSPEQARAKTVDKRTDIWAFGCVLYELLTGKQTFTGESLPEIFGGIFRAEPEWTALPPDTPPSIRALLRRCLQKDVQQRARDAGDLRIEIEEVRAASLPAARPAVIQSTEGPPRRWLLLGALACLAVAAITGIAVWKLRPPQPALARPVSRFVISLPPGDELAGFTGLDANPLALSPDGTKLAYAAASRGGLSQLYLRSLDSFEVRVITGTDGALIPFFSPDGQWLAFLTNTALKKVSVAGGPPVALAVTSGTTPGGSWGPNDIISFSPLNTSPVMQISAAGGSAKRLTTLKGENSHRWSQLLPGGKAVLFTSWTTSPDSALILVQSLETGERKVLVQGSSYARYVPTGHLVYARSGTLLAVPFDLQRLEVKGSPVPLLDGVTQSLSTGAALFSISDSGSLAYVPGGAQGTPRNLVWVDRKGTEQPLPMPPRSYYQPALSPDGRQVVLTIQEPKNDLWIYDLQRGSLTRLTFEGLSTQPRWSPDGKRIAYASNKGAGSNLYWKAADGTGKEAQLTNSEHFFQPSSFSPDGQLMAYVETDTTNGRDIWVVPLAGDRKPHLWLQTPFDETAPRISPDGRWIAYSSNESGRFEVYVQPFPGPGGKWQISTDGGDQAMWNPNGRELFYRSGDKMMAVDIRTQPSFAAGTPRVLFEGRYERQPGPGSNYAVAPDGQRFLMIKAAAQQATATQINVIENWFEELKQKVPVK